MGVKQEDGLAPRLVALHALNAIENDGAMLGAALDAAAVKLDARDKALARHLLVSVLKYRGQIDDLLRRCLSKPLPKAARTARNILRLGIAQLFFSDIPSHAAVHTTVAMLAKDRSPRIRALKNLGNAVMRRLSGEEGKAWFDAQDAVKLNVSRWLWARWVAQYGEEKTRAIARAHLQSAPLDLTPRNKEAAQKLLDQFSDAQALPTGTVRLSAQHSVSDIPGYNEGAWWVQDAAALIPASLAARHEIVVDLCAAPGGKTMTLAAMGAKVTAYDVSKARLARIHENLSRTKLKAEVRQGDALTAEPDKAYDAVLLDAPCSSTGTVRRHPDVLIGKSAQKIADLAALQAKLLDAAVQWVRPGGEIIYAVCSLEKEEGEEQVPAFLERNPDWRLSPISSDEAFGLPITQGWLRVTPDLWADQGGLDGFFIVRFRHHIP